MVRPQTTRVLIVVPNPVVRAGVRTLVEDSSGIEVIGAAETATAAAEAIRREALHVVLADTALGAGLVQLLRAREDLGARAGAAGARPRVVALVTGEIPEVGRLREYVAAGVDGIVSTAEDIGDGLLAVRTGRASGGWISPTLGADILRRVGSQYAGAPRRATAAASAVDKGWAPVAGRVTPSERAVLTLVADGHTDREIASRLQRSERVVKYHVSNLLAKLQARNRAHIVKLALRSGLLSVPCSCGQGRGVRTTRDVAF